MPAMEQRKEHRIKVAVTVKILYQGAEFSGLTGNISRLGAYIETEKNLPLGSEVDLILKVPAYADNASGGSEVRCKGGIFRSNLVREENGIKYYGLGVFFGSFKQEADRQRLSNYVAYLISREAKEIKQGAQEWRQKRKMRKIEKSSLENREPELTETNVAALLKKILERLEEIRILLKRPAKR